MNVLFGFISFLSSVLGALPDMDGWVAVERQPKSQAFERAGDEDDKSIWVIFSKNVGSENFMVRFPEDPQYRHLEGGGIEVSSLKDGNVFLLRVLPGASLEEKAAAASNQPGILLIESKRLDANIHELFYQLEGKWVWERYHSTPENLYIFQTKNTALLVEGHRAFSASLDIAGAKKN